jgi:hypothetical protein
VILQQQQQQQHIDTIDKSSTVITCQTESLKALI